MTKTDYLVLGTVNAPFKGVIGCDILANCLKDAGQAAEYVSHLSVFFGEVTTDLQQAFAREHGVPGTDLVKTCHLVSEMSGENYPLQATSHGG